MTVKHMLKWTLPVIIVAVGMQPLPAFALNDWWDYDYGYDYGNYYDSDAIGGRDDFGEQGWFDW